MGIKRYDFTLLCLIIILGFIQPPISTKAAGTVTISVENLNVREGPGLSYKVIKSVQKGESFSFVKQEGDWYQIALSSSKNGWVANWLVTKKEVETQKPSISKGTINANSLRFREGPGTSFPVIGALNKGDTVEILKEEGNWYQVNARYGKGWISKDYVKTENTASAPPKGNVGQITASSLNVRDTPSLQGKVLGKLANGTKVNVISLQSGWVEIEFNKQKAWVSSEYVKLQTTTGESQENNSNSSDSNTEIAGIVGTVTATSLNVRNTGSLSGQVIGNVKKGETYSLLEEVNNWVKIELKSGKSGWIAGWYLEKSIPKKKDSSTTVKNSTVTMDHNGTNIRSGPSLNHKVIVRANSGETFSLVNIHNDWYEIKLSNGQSGFVAGWIVSASGGAPQVEKTVADAILKNKKIMIDPGHGGRDRGATGGKGTIEKRLTLKTGQLLYNKLKAKGANVFLTRSNDQYLSLGTRVSMSHYQNVDAFISLHYDSINNHTVRGMTSYYYHSSQKALASNIHKSAQAQTGLKDRGVRVGNYHVVRENRQTAVLLELGYLSNPTEELLLNTNQYQEQVTNGIVEGLASYFN
jgi:N-acetylmuramoyl-L-alanine amidase